MEPPLRELPPPPPSPGDDRVILPLPPVNARAAVASGGCLTTFFAVLLIGPIAAFLVLGMWYFHDLKASRNYTVTDHYGKSMPFPYDWVDNKFGLILLVASVCLVALAVAIYADRHHRRSLVAILCLLAFAAIAVVEGAVILRTEPGPVACEACLHPDDIFKSCEVIGHMSSYYDNDPVPCPGSYQDGAERVVKAIDRQAIASIGVGGVCLLAGLVLFIRSKRGGPPTPEVSDMTGDGPPVANNE